MSLPLLLGALCLSLATGLPREHRPDVSNLIYGGVAEQEPFAPFMVFHDASSGQFCGGSLLNQNHVLTAAHCVHNRTISAITIYAGLSHMGDTNLEHPLVQVSAIKSVTIHPKFHRPLLIHDIAIVTLETPFQYTSKIQPIKINVNDWATEIRGQTVSLFGFGLTEWPAKWNRNKLLNQADVAVVDREDCRKSWEASDVHLEVNFEKICTWGQGKGVLQGDSGSPVIFFQLDLLTNRLEARQVGVISGGDAKRQNVPDVHVRASSYCGWITEITKWSFVCSL